MRLKSEIWVSAYIRQRGAELVPAVVVRRGDRDAGAIYIKVNSLDGRALVLRPAAAGMDSAAAERAWSIALGGEQVEEAAADAYLARQAGFDADMWIIEVEDRDGRHGLDGMIVAG